MLDTISIIRFLESHRAVRFAPRLLWRLLVQKDRDCPLKDHVPERLLSVDATQDFIAQAIRSGEPAMIARFGNVELNTLINYWVRHEPNAARLFNRYFNHRNVPFWTRRNSFRLSENAGFFPLEPTVIDAYCELMLECMGGVDLLASWADGENIFEKIFQKSRFCDLGSLSPLTYFNPWSSALAGKRVLIVHPFEESIRSQYEKNRSKIFVNPVRLPEFELVTVKAVQSIAGNSSEFLTWFQALDYMKMQILKLDFDVAIIGCGAYGFPLTSFVKRIGKVAIHLGGETQLLFGILGQRWNTVPEIAALFNESWVRPLPSEVPVNHSAVEGGCYW